MCILLNIVVYTTVCTCIDGHSMARPLPCWLKDVERSAHGKQASTGCATWYTWPGQGKRTALWRAMAAAAAASGVDYDARLLGRPSTFDGSEVAWGDWNFQARAYLETLSPYMSDTLDLAEQSPDPLSLVRLTAEAKVASKQLFYVLANLLKGPAMLELRRCEKGNGLEC